MKFCLENMSSTRDALYSFSMQILEVPQIFCGLQYMQYEDNRSVEMSGHASTPLVHSVLSLHTIHTQVRYHINKLITSTMQSQLRHKPSFTCNPSLRNWIYLFLHIYSSWCILNFSNNSAVNNFFYGQCRLYQCCILSSYTGSVFPTVCSSPVGNAIGLSRVASIYPQDALTNSITYQKWLAVPSSSHVYNLITRNSKTRPSSRSAASPIVWATIISLCELLSHCVEYPEHGLLFVVYIPQMNACRAPRDPCRQQACFFFSVSCTIYYVPKACDWSLPCMAFIAIQ
jgi:hypothetical protein